MLKMLVSLFQSKKSQVERNRFRPSLMQLEDRLVPASVTVNTLMDDPNGYVPGFVTLRDAIGAINANGGGEIDFSSSLFGQLNIYSPLPTITQSVVIKAPPIVNGHPVVDLSGGSGQYRAFTTDISTDVEIDNFGISNFQLNGDDGGAILAEGSSLTLNNDLINYNSCSGVGGGVAAYCSLTMNNCTLSHNSSGLSGGGLFFYGSVADITGSIFDSNTTTSSAGQGGGLYLSDGTTNLFGGCQVTNNHAYNGGGIYDSSAQVNLFGTLVKGNSAVGNGGGIYNGFGGDLFCGVDNKSNPTFIENNSAVNGGGLFISANDIDTNFDGCLISGNMIAPYGYGKGYYAQSGAVVHETSLTNFDGHN